MLYAEMVQIDGFLGHLPNALHNNFKSYISQTNQTYEVSRNSPALWDFFIIHNYPPISNDQM